MTGVTPVTAPTQRLSMGNFKNPSFEDRRSDAAKAKETTLAKFRKSPGPLDPITIQKDRERAAITAARAARAAERELARQAQEAETIVQAGISAETERLLAEQAAREATEQSKRDAALKAEQVERDVALKAEQKATRDVRYAARKTAKKERRRGY
jgi:hypothetical protein